MRNVIAEIAAACLKREKIDRMRQTATLQREIERLNAELELIRKRNASLLALLDELRAVLDGEVK